MCLRRWIIRRHMCYIVSICKCTCVKQKGERKMIGFRVDANESVASGHLMRCISIAEQCMKKGESCLFILAEEKETDRLLEKKIPYVVLQSDWNHLEDETEKMERLIKEKNFKWLVVDSYQVTGNYLSYLERLVPVFYLDDMKKEKYPVSAVLHYEEWSEATSYRSVYEKEKTDVLVGMQYTPLREEFSNCRKLVEREHSILITTGGTDTYNVAGKVLAECFAGNEFNGYEFHVIIGSMNRHESYLQELAKQHSEIHLHKNVKNMSDYMRTCEVAVSAGGTTLFELCACQIPSICFSFAENQKSFAEEMGKKEVMLYAGDAREENTRIERYICKQLQMLLKNSELRKKLSSNMGVLVDGKGAERIADYLCS